MSQLPESYNEFTTNRKIHIPKPLHGETLSSPSAQEVRDHFFNDIKTVFEPHFSALAINAAFYVKRMTSGSEKEAELSDELQINKRQPIAFALQTREGSLDTVRFGVYPINHVGRRVLLALEQADDNFGNVTFHRKTSQP